MSQGLRAQGESWLLAIKQLTQRVQTLERSGGAAPAAYVASTVNTTLGVGFADLGVTATFLKPGRYLVIATFDFLWSVAGAGSNAQGIIVPGGTFTASVVGMAQMNGDAVARQTPSCTGLITVGSGGATIKLQAQKTVAVGTCVAEGSTGQITMAVLRVGS